MARSHGRIQFRIWTDPAFRTLSPGAQRMYFILIGQKDINNAGVLPLLPTRWAKYCDTTSAADVERDLDELEAASFAFVDPETDEVLVRSFIRNDGIANQPNVLKNALRVAEQTDSEKLRKVLAGELRKLRRRDADAVAARLGGEPFENPSGTLREPFENPSGRVEPFAKGSGTLREPCGVGVGVGEESPNAVVGLGGRVREACRQCGSELWAGDGKTTHPTKLCPECRERSLRDHETPPSPTCPKHPGGTDAPCRACGTARERRAAWDAEQARHRRDAEADERRAAAESRAAEIAACSLCDADGRRLDGFGAATAAVCDHNPDRDSINRRGIAEVRAALTREAR